MVKFNEFRLSSIKHLIVTSIENHRKIAAIKMQCRNGTNLLLEPNLSRMSIVLCTPYIVQHVYRTAIHRRGRFRDTHTHTLFHFQREREDPKRVVTEAFL